MTEQKPLRVFISYSHDSPAHKDWVLALTTRLRMDAIDAWIDRYVAAPPEGWPRWMQHQIEEADCVILVCTERYKLRFEGREPGLGRGVTWEGLIANQILYDDSSRNRVFIPVIPPGGNVTDIPVTFRAFTHYALDEALMGEAYMGLHRQIRGVPEIVPHPLPSAEASAQPKTRLSDDTAGGVVPEVVSEGVPEQIPSLAAELAKGPSGESCFSMQLLSPLDGQVFHCGVVCTKYGPEAPAWNVQVVDENTLFAPEGEVRELQPFLVAVGSMTHEALSIVANTSLWIRDPIPSGSIVAVGEPIATLLIPKNNVSHPAFSLSRGTGYGGVLKYRPRIDDRFWRSVGSHTRHGKFSITHHRGNPDSGIVYVAAPSAGVFEEAPRFKYVRGEPVRRDECLGYIQRGQLRHEVRSPHEGVLVSTMVGVNETVHAGQELFRLRTNPPFLHLTMMPAEAHSAGWFELFSPLQGRFQLDAKGTSPDSTLTSGSGFERGMALCSVDTGDIIAKIGLDIAGSIMEVLAQPGERVQLGQPLLMVIARSVLVRAPMTGNFYRASAPNAPPYVELGQVISRGSTLCMIEALKLENEIESDYSGTVTEIHVQNEVHVGYGEPLFTIALHKPGLR